MGGEIAASQSDWAVFLDFDGTLVDIADRPDGIVVPPDLVHSLRTLRERCGGAVAIVTGRSIGVIDGFLPGLDLDICGLHGMERRVGGRIETVPVENLDAFQAAARDVISPFRSTPGVVIENKGESIAFHWRQAPDAEPALREAANRLAAIGGFRAQEGKALVEIVPRGSGKGHAIAAMMERPPYAGRRPLFAGDDVTDENAFPVVNDLGGLTIKVGEGPTTAGRRVANPAEMRDHLFSFDRSLHALDLLDAA